MVVVVVVIVVIVVLMTLAYILDEFLKISKNNIVFCSEVAEHQIGAAAVDDADAPGGDRSGALRGIPRWVSGHDERSS